MPFNRDQAGRKFELNTPAVRIISLVPSLSELICDLGREKELVGITKFCVHPKQLLSEKTIIGGTKNFHFDRIDELRPDLIIANKEENPRSAVLRLSEKYPVYVSDIANWEDALEFVKHLGRITEREKKAGELTAQINSSRADLAQAAKDLRRLKVLYLIWKDPYMAAGTDTFISEMINLLGMENALNEKGEAAKRYPKISAKEIMELKPNLLMLSTEPFPFKQKNVSELESSLNIKTTLVDGEAFSWYGSRILHMRPYIIELMKEIAEMYR